jgi:hypothetical protein
MTTAERLANSVGFTLIARAAMVSTPVVLAVIGWLGVSYLDNRFEAINDKVENLSATVNELSTISAATVNRVTTLEASGNFGRQDRLAFQAQVTDQLKDMQGSIITMSNNVAALTATVQSLKERQAFNVPPSPSR